MLFGNVQSEQAKASFLGESMGGKVAGSSLLFAHVGLVLVIFKNPAMGRKGNFSLERMGTVSRSNAANLHSSRQ